MTGLPFALDVADVLEARPRAVLDDGAVFAARETGPPRDPRAPPVLLVAWLDEPPGVTLEAAVAEDLARSASPPALLVDREPVEVHGRAAVRTFALHRSADGVATAGEQWRLLAGGRRWTVSALTALVDQPVWGPRLAAVATTLRVLGR